MKCTHHNENIERRLRLLQVEPQNQASKGDEGKGGKDPHYGSVLVLLFAPQEEVAQGAGNERAGGGSSHKEVDDNIPTHPGRVIGGNGN